MDDWRSPVALVSSVAVSAALVVAAFLTVQQAGCSDPGHLVTRADGTVQLVGGCIAPGDLVVPGAPLPPPPAPAAPGVQP